MTAPCTQPAETNEADFVEAALMPGRAITAALVEGSAYARMDDLFALADAVAVIDALAPHREAWGEATSYLRGLRDEELVAIGSSPLFRRWLHACGRALLQQEMHGVLDELLPFVRNYTIGFAQALSRLLPRGGIIETWDCTRGARAGPDGQCEVVAATQFLPASHIAVRNDLPGLRVSLDETRVPERETSVRQHDVDGRIDAYPGGNFPLLGDAAGMVLKAWPDEYEDWRQTMRVVVPRLPPSGWQMGGFTLSAMQGAVWINPCDMLTVVESMVHEQSHLKLRYLEDAVALLEPGQSGQRFAVSWRTDARPVVGIFEGMYVHIHCAIALARCVEHGVFGVGLRQAAAARMRALAAQASDGLAILRDNARFTRAGAGYLNWAAAQLRML